MEKISLSNDTDYKIKAKVPAWSEGGNPYYEDLSPKRTG